MCLDPAVESLSTHLLCGPLSLQSWTTKATVVSRQVGTVLWAGAARHSCLGTGQRQGWISVSKRRIPLEPLPAAAPATAHGLHSLMGPDFIAPG